MLPLVLCLWRCGSGYPGVPNGLEALGGVVNDASSGQPIAEAWVGVYVNVVSTDGNATVGGNTTSSPNYLVSAMTDNAGSFKVALPPGTYNAWVFAPGYRCAQTSFSSTDANVALVPVGTGGELPSITNGAFSPSRVIPTRPVDFSAQLAATNPNDPLSDRVLLMYAPAGVIHALHAPGPVDANGAYPDGTWTGNFNAPVNTGELNVILVAATSQCLCGFSTSQLTVAR